MDKEKIKNISLKILFYYSTILSTILIIGGFYTARSIQEIVSNFLFLPVVVFLWILLIQKRRENKNEKSIDKKPTKRKSKNHKL